MFGGGRGGWFKVRKKPVIVEAHGPITLEMDIKTLEGVHHASKGDYIIKGVKGEFYPIKPNIFSETYEPVVETKNAADLIVELQRIAKSPYDAADSARNHQAFARSHLAIQQWIRSQKWSYETLEQAIQREWTMRGKVIIKETTESVELEGEGEVTKWTIIAK